MGKRISGMRLGDKAIEASKTYKVAGWAPVSEDARKAGLQPVWDLVEAWLKAQPGRRVTPRAPNVPTLDTAGNAGWSSC
jgi:S-sulfosulfanyl-L-cysteine sulfohydrolase